MARTRTWGRGLIGALASTILVTAASSGGAVQASYPDGPMCLFELDELSALVGVPFATRDAVEQECVYLTDPAERFLAVVIARVPPDPTALEPDPDGLLLLRWTYAKGGRDLTIAGLPAWISDDGAWVDVGDDVLAVRPMFDFDDDAPPVAETAEAIAREAVPRHLATSLLGGPAA